MTGAFAPTAEQTIALEAARRGGNLKIKAYAGAGKTSTLGLIAQGLEGRRGLYLAFNRAIADAAARRFPAHVASRTMHAHAWAAVSAPLRNRGSLEPEPPHMLAARFGICRRSLLALAVLRNVASGNSQRSLGKQGLFEVSWRLLSRCASATETWPMFTNVASTLHVFFNTASARVA